MNAQQVTKIDCCYEVGGKATIVINNGSSSSSSSSTSNTTSANTTNGSFNFELSVAANTSAGVYNSSEQLIRTLWSGVRYEAGCYTAQWDGLLDDGTQAPLVNYSIKILTNNVNYTWEGVIGNTSKDKSGDHILKGEGLEDMAIIGAKAFVATGYSEHAAAQKMFLTTDPQRFANDLATTTTQSTLHMCTDGTVIYWGGLNYYNNDSWIYGSYPADNANPYSTMVPFSSGVSESFSDASGSATYSNAISVVKSNSNGFISSMCVQKTGNYLFVARNGLNQLQVLNKTTGALVQTLIMPGIIGVECDDSNNLYATFAYISATSTTVESPASAKRYVINTDGTLGNSSVSYTNVTIPTVLGISADYSTISIYDASTSQIKSYSTSTNANVWTLGQVGGFTNNPYAANDKFYTVNFIRYQSDGSFWVGDKENFRTMHFNADRTYKEQVAWAPNSRSSSVDPNNPKRVFCGFVEFERDYTLPLSGTNGSWKLKANWKYNISNYNDYSRFMQVVTLNNNRTYSIVQHTTSGNPLEVYELTTTGARATGVSPFGYPGVTIGRDGTLFTTDNNSGKSMLAFKALLTGFTTEGNPIWGSRSVVATGPSPISIYDPAYVDQNSTGFTNSSTKYIWFNRNTPLVNESTNSTIGYHLGATKFGGNTFQWKASRGTYTGYQGTYPNNGDFDIGNNWGTSGNVNHSLTHAMVYDKDIFWNVNGEFWKYSYEINIWNHFYDDGLFIGQFGITGDVAAALGSNSEQMAGNAFGTAMCKVGNDYYIYHCDESVHAGVHSWHISGLNTIAEQKIPITLNAAVKVAVDASDMMVGLDFRKSGLTRSGNWSISPSSTSETTFSTGVHQYLKDFVDVSVSGSHTQVLLCNLNNTSTMASYTLTGSILMPDQPTIGDNNYNYLELLDKDQKLIGRFQVNSDSRNGYYTTWLFNNKTIAQGSLKDLYNASIRIAYQDFSYSYTNSTLTFKICNYPAIRVTTPFTIGANIAVPAYLRINEYSGGNQRHTMNLYKIKFSSN